MTKSIFIDGQAGTTGLQIHSRLNSRTDINLIQIDENDRKNLSKRKEAINSADIVILCLPDSAAVEAMDLVESDSVRVLDASSAHRINTNWVYGLPELSNEQRGKISNAKFVSNPGCYPTGAILLLRPLIDKALLNKDYCFAINAISGYSGGGKDMIERFENKETNNYITSAIHRYALHHEHKHIKEIKNFSLLDFNPIFMPSYGRYRQGIMLQIPIHCNAQTAKPNADILRDTLSEYYSSSDFVSVIDKQDSMTFTAIEPEINNNSNNISLSVFEQGTTDHVVLCSVFDNLGKGASGAAVQNLEIMLDLEQSTGTVM